MPLTRAIFRPRAIGTNRKGIESLSGWKRHGILRWGEAFSGQVEEREWDRSRRGAGTSWDLLRHVLSLAPGLPKLQQSAQTSTS